MSSHNFSDRHQARQAEPKDYDLNKDHIRSMTLSTYNRIGNITDGVGASSHCFMANTVVFIIAVLLPLYY